MKTLKAFALLFILTALPVSAQIGPDGTGVVNGYQIGPDADLSGAQLRDAYLRGANLRNADLRDADLRGAILSGAILSGANLFRADLSGATIYGADLSGAYLRGANLTDARLNHANLSGADLRDANLRDANFSNANFSNANLSGVDLSGANLSGANLDNADFSGTNLTDTNFGDAFASVLGLNGLKIAALQTELTEKDAKIISLEDRMTALEAQVALLANVGVIQQLQEQIAELSQRPTLEEVRDARAGSVVLTADRENNEVTLNLRVEETDDLKQGTWTTAEGGDLKLTLALAGDKRFMRIALGE